METVDCFDLHDLMLNDDDDIQDAYCKLYNFCMKSLECSTKSKAKFQKVKLEKDDLIAKLNEANNLNENFKIQISSLVDKIKSLEEQLVDLLLGNRVVLKLLMFVTIMVLPVTLVRIVSSCFLISECQIGFILCLKALYLFLVSY